MAASESKRETLLKKLKVVSVVNSIVFLNFFHKDLRAFFVVFLPHEICTIERS